MDFSDEMLEEILRIFQVEADEIISKMNNSLLELEKNPNNKDSILKLFRDAHTLKGASRMVGFNNVQLVAHKMEDILGLAKENKIVLNATIVNVLYKSADILSEIIQKSIDKRQEIYIEDISKHIEKLENIKNTAEKITIKEEKSDFDIAQLKKKYDDINSLISDSLFILMNLESSNDTNLIKELLKKAENLYEIFNATGPYDIKKPVEDIKVKLEFITKASNRLTNSESEEIHKILNEIISKFIAICEIYGMDIIDYYEPVFAKAETKTPEEESIIEAPVEELKHELLKSVPENTEVCGIYDLECIQKKIRTLSQTGGSLKDIKDFLTHFEKDSQDEKIKKIFRKIIELIELNEKNQVSLDEETINVISKSIEHCDNVIKQKVETADDELIFQQLEIVKQVNELKNQSKNTSVIKKHKTPQNGDLPDIFSGGEIKTLRVDSEKLDTLVTQINELTITKIKTQKHLMELNLINESLQEWQRNSMKVLNYLKYYDRKYIQSGMGDSPIALFIKQMLLLHSDNNKKVQEVSNNIADLHKTIQEDDTKMELAVSDIEQMVKNIRILPFSTVFQMFGRMVRDIAQEKNKKIELEILGSETCTDKKIIEEIKAPLIHIIRNSIDHGIEHPEEREKLGKNPIGKIILSARQQNNKVFIEIQDDGKGLNLEKIKNKALQKGYLTQDDINAMSDEQITNIIFAPGFSTGDEITNISGRGIGLDVVKSKISQLNGKVRIISEVNKGCCVQIELPTKMSTLKAFLVECASQTFAIPMDVVNLVLRKKVEEIIINKGRRTIIQNGQTIPLIDLADVLNLEKNTTPKDKETIILLENNDKTMALSVDKLLGDQEILQKKLSAPFYKLKNIAGITTLISGETCLILNIPDVLKTIDMLKPKLIETRTENGKPNSDYNILLVDDSVTTSTLEKNILTRIGYNVEISQNPLEAFEKMKQKHFDLIISDIEMPEMNGCEFLSKLKTDEMYNEIPVIMMSSINDENTKKQIYTCGAQKYIAKHDFEQDEFLKSIDEILRK